MASTILKFPDGSEKEQKIISCLRNEDLDLDVVMFDLGKELNGNHATGVSYKNSEDGLYQTIVDEDLWKRAKELLVRAINEQENVKYYLPSEQMDVTMDPYRELYVRDNNKLKLEDSFNNYLNNYNNAVAEVPSEVAQEMPLQYETQPLGNETPIIATNPTNETPLVNEMSANQDVQEVKIVDENQEVNNNITEISQMPPMEAVVDNSSNENIPKAIIPNPNNNIIENNSIQNNDNIIPFPNTDIPKADNNISEVNMETTTIPSMVDIPPVTENTSAMNNDFVIPFPEPMPSVENANISEMKSVIPEVNNDNKISEVSAETPIIPGIVDIPVVQENTNVMNNDSVIPFPEPAPIETTNINTPQNESVISEVKETPIIPIVPEIQSAPEVAPVMSSSEAPKEEAEKSIVTESYLGNANQIIERMNESIAEYDRKYKELTQEFIKNMEEMKQEMVNQFKEAKTYSEQMKELYETQRQNVVQIPSDGPSLQRVA